ncbi:MAG TPA: beta-L-arabinofuranosidase domain-containing protein, partial [Vicinamibacterales bacterium]|nr:beta-L-arabinofuranosidase domain-containing protein [Vicinamibacterales bacterium]
MTIARRQFLKATSTAAGATALSRMLGDHADASQRPEDVRITDARYRPLADYPIQPLPFSDVRLTDTFWKPKVDVNAAVTIPLEVRKFVDGERGFGGNILEAAILSLKTHPNPALQAQVDAQIRSTAQSAGRGNSGFEVAATLFNVTGRRELLDRAIAAADALYEEFAKTNPPFSGGERDAINCVQLYRVTRDKKHLDLAKHYLDIRGLENSVNRSRHNQSYTPVLEQREAVGHAVNCASLMVSLTDVGVLTGLKPYLAAAQAMWADAATRKMYITGGIGTTGNEGFGEAYALPNLSAYAETCAVLMFATLNHRLFLATGDGKYIDVMERGIYNNALSGVSAGGDRFFYVNRLASAGDGRDLRWERASLECCPPNLVRFLAAMPGLVYAQGPAGAIYVNLYVSSESTFAIGAAGRLSLAVQSQMPWGGKSTITVSAAPGVKRAIKLRIPGWARNQAVPGGLYSYATRVATQATVSVNGTRMSAAPDAFGYVSLDRVWKNGDVIELDLPITPRRVVADARVKDAGNRVCVERGPIVYCAEWPDVDSGKALELFVDPDSPLETVSDPKPFGGVTTIRTQARAISNPSAPAGPITLV